MIFDKKGSTTVITQEKASIIEFVKRLDETYDTIKKDNIIVHLFSLKTRSNTDVNEFLKISKLHKQSKRSFVIVSSVLGYDDVSEELVIVPTLQEAFDIIEMEEIERDLGF